MRILHVFIFALGLLPFISCRNVRDWQHQEKSAPDDGEVHEGGWVSGGGVITGDSANPWFLHNTQSVNYCILIDSDHFSIDPLVIRQKITRSLAYWKSYFSAMGETELSSISLHTRVATQDFHEVPCDDQTDIKLQFGVLSNDQLSYLKDPRNVVAVSVRTSYDPIVLRGKGFIYVSPAKGPLAIANIVGDELWTKGDSIILEAALTHELGHMFGIPHMGDNKYSLMHREYLDNIMHLQVPLLAERALRDPVKLRACRRYDSMENAACALNARFDDECVELRQTTTGFQLVGSDRLSRESSLGLINLTSKPYYIPTEFDFIRLKITPAQRVFDMAGYNENETYQLWNALSVPVVLSMLLSVPEASDPIPMMLRINQNSLEVTTSRAGKPSCSFVFPITLPSPFLFFEGYGL